MLADRLLGLVAMIASAILFTITVAFPFQASVYPSTVLVIIFFLSFSLILHPQSRRTVSPGAFKAGVLANKRVPSILAAVFAFIACIEPLGFSIALFLFMIASQTIMGIRKPGTVLLLSLFMTGLIYAIFSLGLGLNIPMGLLER